MMNTSLTPAELYSRVDLDARIEGSSGQELNRICFNALLSALSCANFADQRGNRRDAVRSLSRAVKVLGGLQRAVDPDAPMGEVLIDFYGSISMRLGGLMREPSGQEIAALQVDIADVANAIVPFWQAEAA